MPLAVRIPAVPLWRSSLRRLGTLLWVSAVTVPTLAACGESGLPFPGRSIVVDRQVLLPSINGEPHAIARLSDGGFAVAGVQGTAWAIATNSKGDLLWSYREAIDPEVTTQYQSEFNGVVPLANGNLLYCGEKTLKSNARMGYIAIFDPTGRLVEQRMIVPHDDPGYFDASFRECSLWNDGIAILGGAENSSGGNRWLLKLDKTGAKAWERLVNADTEVAVKSPAEPGIVVQTYHSSSVESTEFRLIKLNASGVPVAKRVIKGQGILKLRSISPSGRLKVISYGFDRKPLLYSLDEKLEDAAPPADTCTFDAVQGFGYALADDSVVLFGRAQNAAVAWAASPAHSCTVTVFDAKYPSFLIKDAVSISPSQFVTVRASNSPKPADRGLVMSWVTLKQ